MFFVFGYAYLSCGFDGSNLISSLGFIVVFISICSRYDVGSYIFVIKGLEIAMKPIFFKLLLMLLR